MATSNNSQLSILRLNRLTVKIGLGKSAIYDRLNSNSPRYDSTFPKPIKLGGGKNPPIGFLESEIDGWITAQVEKTRSEVSCS
jgi:prophage regulatory protein